MERVIYVARHGDDENGDGTERLPYRTIERARDAVRELNTGHEDVSVVIAGGIYPLRESLTFGPDDGGAGERVVTYRARAGETVVLSGGVALEDVALGPGGALCAPSPGFAFRQLYVGGRRAVRARRPKDGVFDRIVQWDADNFDDPDANPPGARTVLLPADTAGVLLELGDAERARVEVVIQSSWSVERFRVGAVEREGAAIAVTPSEPERTILFSRVWPLRYNASPFHLENARAFVEAPGEWFANEGGVIYQPRGGESADTVTVIAPRLERLICVEGEPDRPVRNLVFDGLTLEHTGWTGPDEHGYLGVQGDFYAIDGPTLPGGPDFHFGQDQEKTYRRPPAAIEVRGAEKVSIEGCVVRHAGGDGIALVSHTRSCRVVGCLVEEISGTGIAIDLERLDDPRPEAHSSRGDAIENCVVRRVGLEYYGSVGIFAGFVDSLRIEHNEVSHVPYSGISLGWGWYDQPNALRNNKIRWNHVHHCMELLQDGAGIYILSPQSPGNSFDDGLEIAENYISDVVRTDGAKETWAENHRSPVTGIYLDSGAGWVTIRDNVLHRVGGDRAGLEGPDVRGIYVQPGHEWLANSPPAGEVRIEASSSAEQVIAAAGSEPRYRRPPRDRG